MNKVKKLSLKSNKDSVLQEQNVLEPSLTPTSIATDTNSTVSSQIRKLRTSRSSMVLKKRANTGNNEHQNRTVSLGDTTSSSSSSSRALKSFMPKDKSRLFQLAHDVKKATNQTPQPTKSKYMDRVAVFLRENYSNHQYMTQFFDILLKRLCSPDDYTSLKAHILFHCYIYSDTGIEPKFKYTPWEIFIGRHTILPNLESRTSLRHDLMFVGKYNRYLNQRLLDYEKLKLDLIRDELYARQKDNGPSESYKLATARSVESQEVSGKVVKQAQCALSQIRLILECIMPEHISDNPLLLSVYNSLSADICSLISIFCRQLTALLQNFFNLFRPHAESTLFLYKEFTQLETFQEVVAFIGMAPNVTSHKDISVPDGLRNSDERATKLTRSLESYLYDDKKSEETLSTSEYLCTPPESPRDTKSNRQFMRTDVGLSSPDSSLLSTPKDMFVEENWASSLIDTLEENANTMLAEYQDYRYDSSQKKAASSVDQTIVAFHEMAL